MANCGKDILLEREGIGQMQRFLDALNPESVTLNDFTLTDWMQFAYNFARHVNYFETTDSETPASDWTDFFKSKSELQDFLQNLENGGNVTPHLALFISFLKLLELSQKRFNNLTKRHLDFYFKEVLNIEKLPATPDSVYVIFELAKNCASEKIAENTLLDGGKDKNGQKLNYKLTDELIANKAEVTQLKNIYNDPGKYKIKAATVANSYNGSGGAFPDNEIQWWPFGNPGNFFPDARLGFALASEILELNEGTRTIKITIEFKNKIQSISEELFQSSVDIYCSGEKEWLKASLSDDTNYSEKKLWFTFNIAKDEEPVVGYNPEVLGESFTTKLPVCRVLFKTDTQDGYKLYTALAGNEIKAVALNVDVKDIKNLELENDIGKLNAEKPFYPFGTQPVRKSNFYIGYPELFKKEWKSFNVEIEWKNTPDSFKELYYAYLKIFKDKSTQYSYSIWNGKPFKNKVSFDLDVFKEKLDSLNLSNSQIDFFEKFINTKTAYNTTYSDEEVVSFLELSWGIMRLGNLIVFNDDYFKANIQIKNREDWETSEENKELFSKSKDVYKMTFNVENKNYEEDKNGPVRLSLNQSFLQELFPRIFALAMSSEEKDVIIPNEPYIPLVETITLNYKAESEINLANTKEKYNSNKVALFHEHPFGQTEEHPYLRSQVEFIDAEENKTVLLPTYQKGGELYIGLKNVEPLQQISLLVQVLEGSENPQAESFAENEKVEWAVLCNNYWKTLDSETMILNETDNFLKSGIVKFSVPAEVTSSNSLLPDNLVWVRAKMDKNFDAVCKTIDVVAQAVSAKFSDNDNELSHLKNGLEADAISKLIQRVPTVKSVSQPFNSFGGKPVESDAAYYRRISERLRHKNRAITLWDYEHLILQKFPEIYKVKCLNHSSELSFLSPGNVLIVVIPDIVNKNVFDIYKPRVSKATLNAVQNWVNKLNTLHINAKVINPDYEEVTVELKVKFHKGFDENYYTKILNKDITKLLSPWAFENSASIEFGVTLHRSVVINYVENLKYVDYIEDVKLIKSGDSSSSNVAPSSPMAILVSARQHVIFPAVKICST